MFGRLLGYLSPIWLERRPTNAGKERFQLAALIVNLRGQGNTSRSVRHESGSRVELKVVECNLATHNAAETLGKIATGQFARGVLPWIPLMQGADEAGIIQQWKTLAAQEPDSRSRSDYGGLALVFAEAAKRWPIWKEALKEWNMVESQQVLEWMAQGRSEGEVSGERNALLRILEKRYSPLPAELLTKLRQTQDLALLRSWFDVALGTTTLAEFRQQTGI